MSSTFEYLGVSIDIVESIIKDLNGRGGFAEWWYEVDEIIRDEIEGDLIRMVERKLDENS